MKKQLTKQEKNWILYDVGNSAFTLMIATIFPIFFNSLAQKDGIASADYLAYWGYASSIATLLIVLIGPICGTMADTKGYKKKIFFLAILIGCAGCVCMGFSPNWLVFLIIFIIAKTGYSASLVFYDSMLVDVTTKERMDTISSAGYAWGYIGSCIPFVLSLVLVLGCGTIGIPVQTAMTVAFCMIAIWWIAMSIPLLRGYEQKHYVEKRPGALKESFKRLGRMFQNIKKERKVFLFLLAFFFYIDGVYTIIDMATAYGQALGLDSTGLLLALLLTQVVAFPCSIVFGRLAKKYATEKLIMVCISAYFGIAVFACFLLHQWQFWLLAVLVGMFQGGIQALSRAYFTKIVPANQTGEFFGIMDICGKGASLIGTTVVGMMAQLTESANLGVAMIAVMLFIGLLLFRKVAAIAE